MAVSLIFPRIPFPLLLILTRSGKPSQSFHLIHPIQSNHPLPYPSRIHSSRPSLRPITTTSFPTSTQIQSIPTIPSNPFRYRAQPLRRSNHINQPHPIYRTHSTPFPGERDLDHSRSPNPLPSQSIQSLIPLRRPSIRPFLPTPLHRPFSIQIIQIIQIRAAPYTRKRPTSSTSRGQST